MLDSIVERINPATKKNLLLGSNRMAKELVNLCPENIVFSNKLEIGKSLEYALSKQIPLCVGATYVIPRQINHAQDFTIKGRTVTSYRFFAGEVINGEVVAIRTISIADFKADFYAGTEMPKVPAMKGQNGGWTTDRKNAPEKSQACDPMEIAKINGRAYMMRPIAVQYNGKVKGWTEGFIDMGDKKALAVKDNFLELEERDYNTFSVVKDCAIPEDIKSQFINGMPDCEKYML